MKLRLQQLKNDLHIKLTNQQLATVSGVLCMGAIAYAAYKYLAGGKSNKTPNHTLDEQKSFQQTYRQVIMNVQECINKHQALNGQVIKCILKNQYKLAQYEYKAFIFKIRNQRRKLMKDRHEYRRVIMTMDAANDELMEKNLNAILAHFNIEKTNWIETVELWSSDTEENKEEWENLLIKLQDELLDSLREKSKRAVSFKKLSEIFRYKIQSLEQINGSGLDLESSGRCEEEGDLNGKHTLIEKYIQDLVQNKFGVEEEDIVFSQGELSKEEQEKIYTMDDEYTDMMQVVIYGEEGNSGEEGEEGQSGGEDEQANGEDGEQEHDASEGRGEKQAQEQEQIQVEIKNEQVDLSQKPKEKPQPPEIQNEDDEQDEGQYF